MSDTALERAGSGLARLGDLLRDGGGLLAGLLAPDSLPARDGANRARDGLAEDGPAGENAGVEIAPAARAASGPRARGHREEYELLVEAIYEGYLLHYGVPRLLRDPEADLGVLAGDRLYAIGLARLVALGDTAAVAELADTITLSALAHGAGKPELAGAVWDAGAQAVGWGASETHLRAKRMVLDGAPGALDAMRTSLRLPPASP